MTRPTTNLTKRPAARPGLELLEDRTVPSWLAQVGGSGDIGMSSKQGTDSAGNAYVGGRFTQAADFDPGPGTTPGMASAGTNDGFVAKYSPAGALLWARRFGGTGEDEVRAVSVDPTGQWVYASGAFQMSADFTGDGAPDATSAGQSDAYVVKLAADTGVTAWYRTWGSSATERADSVAATGSHVYVTGEFAGATDFDPGSGTRTLTPAPEAGKGNRPASIDAYVVKLDAAGSHAASWQIGGAGTDRGLGLVADGDGVFLSGVFSGTVDFAPGAAVTSRTTVGTRDFFLARYDTAAAPALGWVQVIGGSSDSMSSGLLAGDSTSLYFTGTFDKTLDFDPGPGVTNLTAKVDSDTATADTDVFAARYAKADGSLAWAQQIGGPASDSSSSTAVVDEAAGAVYIGGSFYGAIDLNPSGPGGEYSPTGGDGFLVKLGVAGGAYQASWSVGGPGTQVFRPVGVFAGQVFTGGTFQETASFPTGGTLTSVGGTDAYLMALDTAPPPAASVAGGSVLEGADGRAALTFTATPSGAYAAPVVLTYRTADGTATTETALRVPAGSQAPPPAGGRPVSATAAGGRHPGWAALADPTGMWWGVELDPAAASL